MIIPEEIIKRYYVPESELYHILITHSEQVRNKALEVVRRHPELNADAQFIAEAAMLHDIGIFLTNAPGINCKGTHQYIEHGYLGADILRKESLPKHALVCERHTGTGISIENIIENKLPLPQRDLIPISIEEKIICYADKFFSKTKLNQEYSIEKIRHQLSKFGENQTATFMQWHEQFG